MTLYEYIQEKQRDYDAWDTKYNRCVTVVCVNEEEDDYDKFINTLLRKVDFIKEGYDSAIIYADWTKLIKNNLDKFKAFSKEHWGIQYKDKEESALICHWLMEFHNCIAGYINEDFYPVLLKFVEVLE